MKGRSGVGAVVDGRYELQGKLGHGATAVVYGALDRRTGRQVALKLLRPAQLAAHADILHHEYDVLRRLRHPGIVRAYGVATTRQGPLPAGLPYLILEHLAGLPLDRIAAEGPAPPRFVLAVTLALLRVLAHLHRCGWVHRDLKPGNLLLDHRRARALHLKLLDFGLAVREGHRSAPGCVSGSFPFLAPESILGLPVDGRTDLYGAGLLLFTLATGRHPVVARSPEAWIGWHLHGPPADPRPLARGLPPRLAYLVRRLTHRSPAARPSSADHALRLLGLRRSSRPALDQSPM